MAQGIQLDRRAPRPENPLRRPTPRLTTINKQPRPHTQKAGQSRAGRYHCVQYDCANEHLAAWVKRSGVKIGFTRPQLRCVVQMPAEKIATLQPYAPPAEPEPTPDQPQITHVVTPPAAVRAPNPEPAAPTITRPPAEQWQPEPDDPEQHERRKELYRELMGGYDSFEPPAKPKRRWFT